MGTLDAFKPQDFSNTIWAYAKAGESHPVLFKKIGDHIATLDTLDVFKPQDLSNTVWSYATAGEYHEGVFDRLARLQWKRRSTSNLKELPTFFGHALQLDTRTNKYSPLLR